MFDRNVASCLVLIFCLPFTSYAETLFGTARPFATGGYNSRSMVVRDVNGDGKLDILVAGQCETFNCSGGGASSVVELLGNGDGSFAPAQAVAPAAALIAVEDMNNDLKPDLIATIGNDLTIALGNGDGSFQPSRSFPFNGYSTAGLAISDVNRDGKPDVLISYDCIQLWCGQKHYAGVLLGNGDGTLKPIKLHVLFSRSAGLIVGTDLNGDRKPDLAVLEPSDHNLGNGLLTILLGLGDGTFGVPHAFNVPFETNAFDFSDVNGDGNVDVLIASRFGESTYPFGTVGVLLGNGDGTFQPVHNYLSGAIFATSIAVGDVTADGKLDIVVSNWCTMGVGLCERGTIGVLRGNGDGTLNPAETYYSGGHGANILKVADVNRDRKPDVLVLNESKTFELQLQGDVAFRKGLASFETTTAVQSNLNPSVFNQAVTFTATVSSVSSTPPSGTVTFFNGTTNLGAVTLVSGVGTITKLKLPVGVLPITATYNGSTLFLKSTSAPLEQTVTASAPTTTDK